MNDGVTDDKYYFIALQELVKKIHRVSSPYTSNIISSD